MKLGSNENWYFRLKSAIDYAIFQFENREDFNPETEKH